MERKNLFLGIGEDALVEFSTELFRHFTKSAFFFDKELMLLLKRDLQVNNSQMLFYDNNYRLQSYYSMVHDDSPTLFSPGVYHTYYIDNPIYQRILESVGKDIGEDAPPVLYCATDIVSGKYESSEFATFLSRNFDGMDYAIVVPFGSTKRVRFTFLKDASEADFSKTEKQRISLICGMIEAAYHSFISFDHNRRTLAIVNRLLESDQTGLLVLNSEMKTISCNRLMELYLSSVLRDDSLASKLELISACLRSQNGEYTVNGYRYNLRISREQDTAPYESGPNYYITMTPLSEQEKETHQLFDASALLNKLSRREQEIAMKVISRSSYRQIGDELFISESTVRKHAQNIFRKLGVKNRSQLLYQLYHTEQDL